MTTGQRLAREAAVRELDQAFRERGGIDVLLDDRFAVEDTPCALHSIPVCTVEAQTASMNDAPLPRQGADRELVFDAVADGCHVFLTADKKILRCHRFFIGTGLAILSPAQLLEELDATGELDDCDNPRESPAPDISALARFYGAFSKDCFEPDRS
jgi:hypothetical protein